MKRIMFAALAAASVTLLAAGCGSDSASSDTPETTSTATQSDSDALAQPVTTGDIYQDTCNGVLEYIKTLTESGLTGEDNSPEKIGAAFIAGAKSEPDWADKSAQDQADFERAVNAAVAGSC